MLQIGQMNLEGWDAVTWAASSCVAMMLRITSKVDYIGSFLLLCLLCGAFVLMNINQRPMFRPGAGSGIVCGLMAVPSALAAIDSPMFHTALVVAIVLCALFLSSKSVIPRLDSPIELITAIVISIILTFVLGLSVFLTICAVAMGCATLIVLMTYAPDSFSLGEFLMVSTLSTLPLHVFWCERGIPHFEACFVLAGIIALGCCLIFKNRLSCYVLLLPILFVIPDVPAVIKCVLNMKRIMLLVFCGVMCGAFLLVSMLIDFSKYPVTVQRKYFHLMALLVFVPPVLVDYQFFRLCISGAIFTFLAAECLRLSRWPYVSAWIEQYVSAFLDDRDCGELILTHLFLLLGLGLPVLLCDGSVSGAFSVHVCGVCVLAIGDATASVVGVRYGKHKWPGSKKSYEGTGGAFVGTWLSLLLIEQFNEINMSLRNILRLAVPAVIGALDEAFTSQIDNLTLPFVMIPFIVFVKRFL